jgi:hypothetical protein
MNITITTMDCGGAGRTLRDRLHFDAGDNDLIGSSVDFWRFA